MTTDLTTLAELFLGHLVREEACLRAARAGLDDLNHAFADGDLPTLQAALERASLLADLTQKTRDDRDRVRVQLAEYLDLDPETVNLSAVSARMPAPYSARIASYRDRLQVLAAEVERQTARAANAAGFCRGFIGKTLSEMTDGKAAVTQYGPTHRRDANRGAALLVAQG
jgi:uncharacterized protein YeeX (DUF496 family)